MVRPSPIMRLACDDVHTLPIGVEPWTFYFFNSFLNFNLVFVLALLAVFLMEVQVCGGREGGGREGGREGVEGAREWREGGREGGRE